MLIQVTVLASYGHTYDRGAINIWLEKSDKSPLTNKVLENIRLNRNIAVRQMLTTIAESTPPEVKTILTEEVINIDIESETTLQGHASRHEPNYLSTRHASRHEPNVLSPGHDSQQQFTHNTNMFNGCVHRKHAVSLILKKGKGVMWHEALYHSGAKFRESPIGRVKSGLRLFMYLWPFISKNQRNRTVGTTDGVAREFGELLYRNNLDEFMCPDFYDEVCEYPHCMEGETVIDCTCVPSISFNQVGKTIVGNLEKYGWVVMRGLIIDPSTATKINNMAMRGAGKEGAWKSIETSQKNHKMKYDHSSRFPQKLDNGYLGKLLSDIIEKIFDIMLQNTNYMIGRHNLLKNNGIVEHDQKPHADYPIRLSNTRVILNYIVILLSILCISYLIVVVIFVIY